MRNEPTVGDGADALDRTMTLWRREAHARIDAASALRSIALDLPAESKVREHLLYSADTHIVFARLRGVEPELV